MNKHTLFAIITVLFLLVGIQIGSFALILISGNLFGPSIFTQTFGVLLVWAIILLYFYLIPYRINKLSWRLILLCLITFTIFSYVYDFPVIVLED